MRRYQAILAVVVFEFEKEGVPKQKACVNILTNSFSYLLFPT
jgi:hypothetical protein